jgi:hypothetical protein
MANDNMDGRFASVYGSDFDRRDRQLDNGHGRRYHYHKGREKYYGQDKAGHRGHNYKQFKRNRKRGKIARKSRRGR